MDGISMFNCSSYADIMLYKSMNFLLASRIYLISTSRSRRQIKDIGRPTSEGEEAPAAHSSRCNAVGLLEISP